MRARSASVQSRLEEERVWFSEQMSDLLNSSTFSVEVPLGKDGAAELAGLCSLERVVALLGGDRARVVRGICSKEKWAELQASSAAIESEDEEQLLAVGLDRVYRRFEKILGDIEKVKRHCNLDGQSKELLLTCKQEALRLAALLVEHNRLSDALAEKVVLLYGEDDESDGESPTTDMSQVD